MKLIITTYINEEQTSKKKVIESINNGNVSNRWCLR